MGGGFGWELFVNQGRGVGGRNQFAPASCIDVGSVLSSTVRGGVLGGGAGALFATGNVGTGALLGLLGYLGGLGLHNLPNYNSDDPLGSLLKGFNLENAASGAFFGGVLNGLTGLAGGGLDKLFGTAVGGAFTTKVALYPLIGLVINSIQYMASDITNGNAKPTGGGPIWGFANVGSAPGGMLGNFFTLLGNTLANENSEYWTAK